MVLKLYGRLTSGNVQKVAWFLEEFRIPHERIDAGGTFGLTTTPWFREMNPNSRVPAIDDDGFFLFESHAILRYLAATRVPGHAICPAEPKARATIEAWMDWLNAHLGPPITVLFWQYVRTAPEQRDMAAIEKARKDAETFVRILEDQIGSKKYLLGDDLTVADIALGPFIHRWFNVSIERPAMPNLERWYKQIQTHEGCRKYVTILPLV